MNVRGLAGGKKSSDRPFRAERRVRSRGRARRPLDALETQAFQVVALSLVARDARSVNTLAGTTNFLAFRSYILETRVNDKHSKDASTFVWR
jgi:hypothetical protein